MEFLDEESRPRFLFQSRTTPPPSSQTEIQLPNSLHKRTLFVSLSLSSLLLALSFFYLQSEPFTSILHWFFLSLLIGPFAPSSLTAGDIRVGLGPPLETPQSETQELDSIDSNKRSSNRRSKSKKPEETVFNLFPIVGNEIGKPRKIQDPVKSSENWVEEREWSEGDLELLKKQMVKHPVGIPGRWEAVAEAFSGRFKVESVVKMAKSMGEKKLSDSDSFTQFLKDRKPVDKRIDDESGEEVKRESGEVKRERSGSWSSAEDLALLNALKAFPKDVAMRWEKITAAVPGRSKAACMKRVSDMKKDFRSSKASTDA